MKFCLIYTIVFVFLLQGAAFAQQTVDSQSNDNSPCPDYSMPVIKPLIDENKLPIVKPENKIDYKLIIVNPCLSKTEQAQNSTSPIRPNNVSDWKFPAAKFKLDENVFTFTPSKSATQKLFLFPKQPQ